MGMGQSAMPAAPRPQFAAAHDPIKAQAFTELRAKLARYLGMQMWAQLEAEVDARAMTLLSIPNLPASPYSEVLEAALNLQTFGALWGAMMAHCVPVAAIMHAVQIKPPPTPQQQADGAALLAAMRQCWQHQQQAAALMAYQQAVMQGAPVWPAAMGGPWAAPPHPPGSCWQCSAVGLAGSLPQAVPSACVAGGTPEVPQPQPVGTTSADNTAAQPAAAVSPAVLSGILQQMQAALPQQAAATRVGHPAAQPAAAVSPALLSSVLQQLQAALPQEAAAGGAAGASPGILHPGAGAAGSLPAPAAQPAAVSPALLSSVLQQLQAPPPQQAAAGGAAGASPGILHPGAGAAGSLPAPAAAPATPQAVKPEAPGRPGGRGNSAVKRPRGGAGSGSGGQGGLGGEEEDEGGGLQGLHGDAGEALEEVDDEEALQGVLEGLKHADGVPEEDVPPGSLRVTLHPYQRRALGWMRKRENARAVPGGILADEQGLGKTVQAIALIVAEPPTHADAELAIRQARTCHAAAAQHPESAQARAARSAGAAPQAVGSHGAGASPAADADGASATGGPGPSVKAEVKAEDAAGPSSAGGTPPKTKKPKKAPPRLYEPCGRGPYCTCAICRKAHEQQAQAEEREVLLLARAKAGEVGRGRKAGAPSAQLRLTVGASGSGRGPRSVLAEPKLQLPDSVSLDGQPARRTLVICPLSVAAQWVDEVRDKAPQLHVALYHGPSCARDFSPALLAGLDVVVTTYGKMHSECASRPQGALFRLRWHRCILDEAQSIRNARTQVAKSVLEIRAERRWCLTGTPIVNAATDVYMLFKFLQYQPFCKIEWFNRTIRNKIQTVKYRNNRRVVPNARQRAEGFRELRTAIQAITLRRMKTDQYDGQALVQIPAKHTNILHLPFTDDEAAIYLAYEEQTQVRFNRFVREGFGANYSNILVLLMRLRQVCIHPWLAQTLKVEEEAPAEDQGQLPDPHDPFAHPSGLEHEVAADLLARLRAPDAGECPICMDAPQAPAMTACAHGPFCHECILAALQHQGSDVAEGRCPLCRGPLTATSLYTAPQLEPVKTPVIELSDSDEEAAGKPPAAKGEDDEEPEEPSFVSSTKLDAVLAALQQAQAEDEAEGRAEQPTRTIVFSTFVRALDLVEARLEGSGIGVVRLDGSMTIEARGQAVRQFARDPHARVLLASTRSAGLGLNLTCASRVTILDVWWNGASEDQAVDRAHRLGQAREVLVDKLIMTLPGADRETVEQRIMVMQDDKRQVAQAALGADGTTGQTRLSLDELRKLFGIGSRRAA